MKVKCTFLPKKAVNEIRDECFDFPFSSNSESFLAYLDYKMGKNNISEYRKRLGLEN